MKKDKIQKLNRHKIDDAKKKKRYPIRVKDLPQEEKPREKLMRNGAAALSIEELFAVIIGRGNKKEGVLEISKRIMRELEYSFKKTEMDVQSVKKFFGVSTVPACQIVSVLELGKRLFGDFQDYVFRSSEDVFEYAKNMGMLKKELMKGLYLNTRNKLIRDEVISIGSLNIDYALPREILSPALEYRAAAFILIHNHPSGDPEPSEDDIKFTRKIKEASKILGIPFLDHIIIGKNKYKSLRNIIEE